MNRKRFFLLMGLALLVFVVVWIPALFSARFWSATDGMLVYTRGSALTNFVFQAIVAVILAAAVSGVSSVFFKLREKLRSIENSMVRLKERLKSTQMQLSSTQVQLKYIQLELEKTEERSEDIQSQIEAMASMGLAKIDLEVKDGEATFSREGQPLDLKGKQLQLLNLLYQNRGEPLTADKLRQEIYTAPPSPQGVKFVSDEKNSLKALVSEVRQKLIFCHDYIETHKGGRGYSFKQWQPEVPRSP